MSSEEHVLEIDNNKTSITRKGFAKTEEKITKERGKGMLRKDDVSLTLHTMSGSVAVTCTEVSILFGWRPSMLVDHTVGERGVVEEGGVGQ